MDLESTTLSEVRQTEKGKYQMTSLVCGVSKTDTCELIYKTETDSQFENKLMVIKGERWRGDEVGIWN